MVSSIAIKYVLEAVPHKATTVWPLTTDGKWPWKLSKLDKPDMRDTGGEVGTKS